MGATYYTDAEPPRLRDLAVPAPARREPGGLVRLGGRGVLRRARSRSPGVGLDRLRRVPLVPRDGARVLRGPGGGLADERVVRVHQGGPRGAPGRRRDLHGRGAGDDGFWRLAAQRLPDACGRAVLRGHLLPAAAAARAAVVVAGGVGDRRVVGVPAGGDRSSGGAGPAAGAGGGRARGAGNRGLSFPPPPPRLLLAAPLP